MSTNEPATNNASTGSTGQMPGFPPSFLKNGELGSIISVSGKEDVRRFLSGLGFTPGVKVRIVNTVNGNVIVEVKNSRVAIDKAMASKIKCYTVS